MCTEKQRLKLQGGEPGRVTTLILHEDGTLLIELYDFSSSAQEYFGNDVAYLLKIAPGQKRQILFQLISEGNIPEDAAQADALLLARLAEHFEDYAKLKSWLETQQIPFEEIFDSWA